MRILQIITRSERRGAEVFAAQLSERLTRRGHRVVLAALYDLPGELGDQFPNNGAERVQLRGKVKGRIEQMAMLRLSRLVHTIRPDVVQANAFHALKYAALLKRMTRGSWPLVYRNVSMASHWTSGALRRQWGRWLLRSVERVLSVSDAAANDFCATYGFPKSRVITIRRGVEIPREVHFQDMRRRIAETIGCRTQDPMLFHLGGFTPEKNHEGLLRALARVRLRFPDVRLILCGDGPLLTSIENRAAKLGLSGNVFFFGNRPDATDLLHAADLLLLSSHIEGIPGVILEAAARMVPAVATDVGSVSEAVCHQSSGLLVPAGDMDSLADACCELLADPARRKKMGQAARRFVAASHELGESVDRFEDLYRLLSGPLSRAGGQIRASECGA